MEELYVWKTRDAAEELLSERRKMLLAPTSTTTSGTAVRPMPVRDEFDTSGLTQRLFHSKSVQIQQAFHQAASCVLKALSQPPPKAASSSSASAATAASSAAASLYNDPDLPDVLHDWTRLEESRRATFDRTHNNKEYIKKKKLDASSAVDNEEVAGGIIVSSPLAPSSSTTAVVSSGEKAVSSGSSLPGGVTPASGEPGSMAPPATTSLSSDAAGGAAAGGATAATSSSTTTAPKFTRNTPASSAAALDFRFNSSRAILCAAGNLVFEALTPSPSDHVHLDALSVPQNPAVKAPKKSTGLQVNMGAVVVEAQLLSQRTISVVENAIRRSNLRYLYRRTNAEYDHSDKEFLQIPNPYMLKHKTTDENAMDVEKTPEQVDDHDDDYYHVERLGVPYRPNQQALTETWTDSCLPRFLAILERGAGHAIYHDFHWKSRHGRVADLLRHVPNKYGPHLIVTIEPEVLSFCQEFENGHVRHLIHQKSPSLRVIAYHGNPKQRRILRTRLFQAGKGLETSPWHVMVTSYSNLLQDFLHFSQVPLDSVILDDGVLWMATAHGDPNSGLGSIWDNLFAKNDQQIGLAGTTISDEYWNYALDGGDMPESVVKDGWVGLTCRHRILTSSTMAIDQSRGQEKIPVTGLLSFVAPHFADVVREEWDRSRITSDADSMGHFRNLVARSTVAHCASQMETNETNSNGLQETQAILALNGKLESRERTDPMIPEIVYDDSFVSDGKINFSRRSCLSWLGRLEKSWLRYELGKAMLQHILDAMKVSNRHGHICEEITTASSTTSSGATGQVAGSMAYRLAIRCCRHFGSEQGLRQHVSALHAPPGTWLCRTCGSDCISSQARTHHERSCGVPGQGSLVGEQGTTVGATPTVGQGSTSKSGVGKKKPGRSSSAQQSSNTEEKDADGSFRVPGYRGVWVNQAGKHFVKIAGARLKQDNSEELLLFDNIDDAARKHDEILKKEKKGKLELNFKADGSRIVYEDISPASTSGLGGSATTVVPALSIINIKDLPPDVKPLLRDPRQTSRTGGNSKRHVYAYRGVCRQARKGHDRWQSQISFMGVNHYLGTFDSEWDAAAIYAWAHLILYGEEATRQAQKEGEEAAAAYEREQKDIAAGKLPEPSPKKKPKKPPTKKDTPGSDKKEGAEGGSHAATKPEGAEKKKRKSIKDVAGAVPEKKTKTNTKACKLEKEAIGSTVAKGVTRASVIAPKEIFEDLTDEDLLSLTATKVRSAKESDYCVSELRYSLPAVDPCFRPCLPVSSDFSSMGGALLLGLSPSAFGWDLQEFLASQGSEQDMTAIQLLAVEYDEDGVNEKFASVMQGTVCILGRASDVLQRAYKNLGLGTIPLGGSVGKLDCHIGGVPGSCGESAACIRYTPADDGEFRLSCFSDDDVVTLNGRRITVANGSVPLFDEDVISVGARVFAFVLSRDQK